MTVRADQALMMMLMSPYPTSAAETAQWQYQYALTFADRRRPDIFTHHVNCSLCLARAAKRMRRAAGMYSRASILTHERRRRHVIIDKSRIAHRFALERKFEISIAASIEYRRASLLCALTPWRAPKRIVMVSGELYLSQMASSRTTARFVTPSNIDFRRAAFAKLASALGLREAKSFGHVEACAEKCRKCP